MLSLYDAALKGDVSRVRHLLASGMSAEQTTPGGDGRTAVMGAAACTDTAEPLQLLVEVGSQLNKRDKRGWAALHHACAYGTVSNVDMLLTAGADVNLRDNDGFEPIHTAAQLNSTEVVELLLEWGANMNAVAKLSETPLICAAGKRPDNVRLLLERGADADRRNKWNSTALHWAAKLGCHESVKHLLEHDVVVTCHNNLGDTPLHLASTVGKATVILLLIQGGAQVDAQNEAGETPLAVSCRHGHVEAVTLLLERRAQPNLADAKGNIPLHVATRHRHMGIVDMLIPVSLVNVTNRHGRTALMDAAENGSAVVRLLLKCEDIDVEQTDGDGNTALHLACLNGSTDAAQALASFGVELQRPNAANKTPLILAVDANHGQILKVLLAHMALTCSGAALVTSLARAWEADTTQGVPRGDLIDAVKKMADDEVVSLVLRYRHVLTHGTE